MKQFLVIGLGRFGRAVAEGLADAGADVIAVDTDMTLVEAVRDRVSVAAQVDSVEPEALRALNATEVDAAVVAIGEDFAAEVLTVAILRELGVGTIVARAPGERERRILELVGATRVISVEVDTGQRVARSLVATDVVDLVSLGSGVSIVYWTADERAIRKPLGELELLTRFQLHVLAIRPAGMERLDLFPGSDHVVQEGDVLLLVGADARLAAFTK